MREPGAKISNSMPSPVGYIGATFALLLTLASLGFAVLFATIPHWGGVVVSLSMAAMVGWGMVYSNDWPKYWKPLLTKMFGGSK